MADPVDSLKAFVARSPRDSGYRHHPAVVVFGAGKGGVGTSTLAGMTALHAAAQGASVLMVDADETVGSLHLMFGVQQTVPGLGILRGGSVTPKDLLFDVAPGVALLPGGGGGVDATLAVASAERRMLMRRVAGLYDDYELVVVDGGSRLDSVMAACAAGSGRLVCVTTADHIAQTAAYALLKVTKARFSDLPVELMVNRADDAEGQRVHRVVEGAVASFLRLSLPYAGAVPEDARLRDHVGGGGALTDSAVLEGPASEALGTLAEVLLRSRREQAGSHVPVLPLVPDAGVAP